MENKYYENKEIFDIEKARIKEETDRLKERTIKAINELCKPLELKKNIVIFNFIKL